MPTGKSEINIFLADDDEDDCILFGDVLAEIVPVTHLTCLPNGKELIDRLTSNHGRFLPDIIFLDVNMPMKNGLESLHEIKHNDQLRHLPVIMLSTSAQHDAVTASFEGGAQLYLKKPDSFLKLKEALAKILLINWKHQFIKPSWEDFLIIK